MNLFSLQYTIRCLKSKSQSNINLKFRNDPNYDANLKPVIASGSFELTGISCMVIIINNIIK